MATDLDPNIVIETSGITATIATDVAQFSGATAHFQITKMAYGLTGSATLVSSTNPLPVTVAAGLTATISGFTGTITVQGSPSGTALPVSGTVVVTGVTSTPLYVTTASGSRVEITGGIPLSKATDSVSVWGPQGLTYIYAHVVGASMQSVGVSGDALKVALVGAGLSATFNISSTVGVTNDTAGNGLRIQGMSGGLNVPVTVGNTVGINDTALLTGLTAVYGKVDDIYDALSVFGLVRPSGVTAGRLTVTNTANSQVSTGYTCYAGVNLKAASYNTDIIYVGNSTVSSTLGYELDPGEQLFLNVGNANEIYLRAKSSSQIISFFAS